MFLYPKQIVIEDPLWGFIDFCEVYCSAGCCGIDAFEVHPALLLRKVADMNLAGAHGDTAFRTARHQLADLKHLVETHEFETVHTEIPIWRSVSAELPEFCIGQEELRNWLKAWDVAFEAASQYHGLQNVKTE